MSSRKTKALPSLVHWASRCKLGLGQDRSTEGPETPPAASKPGSGSILDAPPRPRGILQRGNDAFTGRARESEVRQAFASWNFPKHLRGPCMDGCPGPGLLWGLFCVLGVPSMPRARGLVWCEAPLCLPTLTCCRWSAILQRVSGQPGRLQASGCGSCLQTWLTTLSQPLPRCHLEGCPGCRGRCRPVKGATWHLLPPPLTRPSPTRSSCCLAARLLPTSCP